MKKIFFILFSVVEFTVCSNGQAIDTVIYYPMTVQNRRSILPTSYTMKKIMIRANSSFSRD